jgi:hypothetical protein
MSVKNRSGLTSITNTNLPDNNTKKITAAKLRAVLYDFIDSAINRTGDNSISGLLKYAETHTIEADEDLVHKKFVVDYLAEILNDYVQLSGDTMTGTLINENASGQSIIAGNSISVYKTASNNMIAVVANDTSFIRYIELNTGRSIYLNFPSGGLTGTYNIQIQQGDGTLAFTSDIETAINNLIGAAPGALNTLDELAAALADDANFASTVTTALAGKESLSNKDTDGTLAANSDTNYPTQKAVKTYVDTKVNISNGVIALVDGASIDLSTIKHSLTTNASARTFTISYSGDDITLEVTLNASTCTFTFPATSFCISEGVASGDNTCVLNGTSGDKYILAIKKIGSTYYVACKNFGQ